MPDTAEPPVAPTPAAPSAPAFPSPVPPSVADFDKHFDDLEGVSAPPSPTNAPSSPSTTPPDKDGEGASRPKDPVTGKFVPKTDKSTTTPTPEPKPKVEPAKPIDDESFDPDKSGRLVEIRGFAIRQKKQNEKLRGELEQLKTKLQEVSMGNGGADVKALTEELANTKQRVDAYEKELRVTRYERSEEYKEKYKKPYDNAVNQAYSEVKELIVYGPPTEEGGEPTERQATPADFDEIYHLPLGPATKLAKQKFGDASFIVLQHRNAIKNAYKTAFDAVEEHKVKGADYEKAQTTQQQMEQQGKDQMFNTALDAIHGKYPEIFGEHEGDSDWNGQRTKGIQIADLAFSARKGMTPQQSAILDAQVYSRLVAFGPLRISVDKLTKERDSLKKELDDIRASAPGKPQANGAPVGDSNPTTWEAHFDKTVPE